MKRINFSDKFGLTQAVLDGRKTQTRRIIPNCTGVRQSPFSKSGIEDNHGYELKPKYHVGEVVAVAQSYKEAGVHFLPEEDDEFGCHNFPAEQTKGWTNKMFTRANLTPYCIRITDVRVERLNDISDDDCIAEGIRDYSTSNEMRYGFSDFKREDIHCRRSPREAYAALIDKISGKGVWSSNPYVFVYEFELVK